MTPAVHMVAALDSAEKVLGLQSRRATVVRSRNWAAFPIAPMNSSFSFAADQRQSVRSQPKKSMVCR